MLKQLITDFKLGQCDEADNGEQALQMFKASMNRQCCGPYKKVVLDNQMPFMSGKEVAQKISELNTGTKLFMNTGEDYDNSSGLFKQVL